MEKQFEQKTFTLEVLYHVGIYENSIHFIFDHESKKCAIIDPAWEADRFIDKVKSQGYELTDIWLTHWHPDHMNAADEIADKTGAKITAGIDEVPYLKLQNNIHTVNDNDEIWLGATSARIINTPGHTAGGICFLLDGHLIAGDTLFVYGAGHCALPGGNANTFFHSLQKLKTLDDDIILHCGHDYGIEIAPTMSSQKSGNPFLLIDNEKDFVRYRNEIHDGSRQYPMAPMQKSELNNLL